MADVLALDLAHVLGHLLDDVDLGAALGRGAGALDARVAGADHEDLGVDGLGDLIVGDDGLLAQPVGGAHVARGGLAGHDGSLEGRRGFAGLSGCGSGNGSHGSGDRSAGHERATVD